MATFTKHSLSGSTQGKAIKVTETQSPGTIIHETGTSSSIIDEVWLYAANSDASSGFLTIQWGGTASPDDSVKILVPGQSGITLIIPGFILTGTGSAANSIRAFGSITNVITVHGYVNRIQ